ncbi:MAG TPA: circadian clock protein KaiB [Sediminispirochaeta sp.]|nr:circadian clock protein KaiB [Sediminispirochaeta sp.]
MNSRTFKLYITGRTSRAQEAVRSLNLLSQRLHSKDIDVVVIDVLENPDAAEQDKILATPTLLFQGDHGENRIIGDLSNTEEVLKLLNLR